MGRSLDEINIASAYLDGLITNDDLLAESGESFGALVEVCGEMAARLVDAYGGTRLYIPNHLNPNGFLVQKLGIEAAQALVDLCGREDLIVPRLMSLRRIIRNRKILASHAKGSSPKSLALQFNLTERQIYSILCQGKCPSKQGQIME